MSREIAKGFSKYDDFYGQMFGRAEKVKGSFTIYTRKVVKVFGELVTSVEKVKSKTSDYWDKALGLPKQPHEFSEDLLSKLPIKVNNVDSLFLGLYHDKVGSRPQRGYGANPFIAKMLANKRMCPYPTRLLKEAFSSHSIIEGAWDTNYAAIQRMADPHVHTMNFRKVWQAVSYYSHELVMPACPLPDAFDIFDANINWKKMCGIDSWSEGYRTKAEAFNTAFPAFISLFKVTSDQPTVINPKWTIGGRWRRNKKFEDDSPESRIVIFCSFIFDMLCKVYQEPVSRGMRKMDLGFNAYACPTTKTGWQRLLKFRNGVDHHGRKMARFACDPKSHDSTRTDLHKEVVFSLLRACFPQGKQASNHFFAMLWAHNNINLVTPGRFMYLLRHGNPSGTVWTSQISTLSNWVDWCYIRFHYEPFKEFRDCISLNILGDDTEVYVPEQYLSTIDFEDLSKWCKDNCSLDLPSDEFHIRDIDQSAIGADCASFLKVGFDKDNLPGQPRKDIANKDLCPKKFRSDVHKVSKHITDLCSAVSLSPVTREFLVKRLALDYKLNVIHEFSVSSDEHCLARARKYVEDTDIEVNHTFRLSDALKIYDLELYSGRPHLMGQSDDTTISKASRTLADHLGMQFVRLPATWNEVVANTVASDYRDVSGAMSTSYKLRRGDGSIKLCSFARFPHVPRHQHGCIT